MSNKWLVTKKALIKFPERVKQLVADARDMAQYLGMFKLGIVELQDGDERFILIAKSDFEDWFGDVK